jgi:beta-glucosidase
MSEGVDLRGYLHWSLLDNYEWTEGFTKRFGLVEINYATQERTVRPSAYAYKEIIEANSIDIDTDPT